MPWSQIDTRLRALQDAGVRVVDPRQTFVGPEVRPERVCPGTILHPGTRVSGARAYLGAGAEVGREGPVTLVDTVLGAGARADGGYLEGAVLFENARAGMGAHFRPGTILEEEASTAHTVGLKHTILLSFVTLGSLINFCDVLMAGGTSRSDHSEVGSGFIHFNFTPWGAKGDKATPSLIGDVPTGVFLRASRIFLGGSSGLVGPGRIGFGSITAAGQVVRRDVAADRVFGDRSREFDLPRRDSFDLSGPRVEARGRRNVEYIGQLVALQAWYREVRSVRADDAGRPVVEAALDNLDACIEERVQRWAAFLRERNMPVPTLDLQPRTRCPLTIDPARAGLSHVQWVQERSADEVEAGIAWLESIVADVVASAT